MHRFYLPPQQITETGLVLTGSEAHHALRVLRVQRGEPVTVLDGAGHEFRCQVRDTARGSVRLEVIEKRSSPALPCKITLLQGIPKGRMMESIVQKATELGVHRIVPLVAERVVSRLDDREAAHKAEKWQAVAIEAIKQCGAVWLPRVDEPVTPQQFLAQREKFDLALVGSLQADSRHPREYFTAFQSQTRRRPESVAVWVGPEGDFSREELDAIQAAGAKPITLGPLVLRCETAAVYCLSVLNYELRAP
jgi:16S rRNA (uracil1498-N3)-methyltransferase